MSDTFIAENDIEVGETIPPLTAHAVSVSLPTWRANVGYEEGQEWVVSKMKTGYPRFFIHKSIEKLAHAIVAKHGRSGERAILFPSHKTASGCLNFFRQQAPELDGTKVRILDLVPIPENGRPTQGSITSPKISAVIFPEDKFPIAKTFWQHSGEGVSSRRAEYAYEIFTNGLLADVETIQTQQSPRLCKGPKRYQRKTSMDITPATNGIDGKNGTIETQDPTQFVEQRFGRNLDLSMAASAKLAVRRRIAGSLTADTGLPEALQLEKDVENTRKVAGFSEDDVYLYPGGMNAIFNTHQTLLKEKNLKSIVYGFPYIDTLKITEKFGPGSLFYGFGSSEELDDLERRLKDGERYLALFTEFPGNPLLKTPDIERIRNLADQYDFYVVIDETIGNFLNVNVLPYADIVVSSLTKVFSGDSNVMGGAAVLNPKARFYSNLKLAWETDYEDNHWGEDSIFLERNSRDFVSRIERINTNAEAICDVLRAHPRVKQVNYPKYSPTRHLYDKCRNPGGGYGGLLSATFYSTEDAVTFFDNLDTAKGPSLGTNFTLSSPYIILAHYNELDWCAKYGVEADLVRFSVGLEESGRLQDIFRHALKAISSNDGC